MAFIIIDLEFNNLSEIHKYYPNIYKDIPNLKELDLINEIIEIGAIKVDMYMKPLEELKVYIKPSVIPVVNPKILSITNIKHEELENGVSFNEGLDMLKNMVDKGDIIASALGVAFEAVQNSGEILVCQAALLFVHEQDADVVSTVGLHGAGRHVWYIAHPAGRLPNTGAGGFGDIGLAVERLAHGGDRDSALPCQIFQG